MDIEDNGPGIPREMIDQIFQPLVTGRHNGTGLGLSITEEIIQNLDGKIAVTSDPGQTVFSVFLQKSEVD